MPIVSKKLAVLVVAVAVTCAPDSGIATELTMDQMPSAENMFGGDMDTEFHQVEEAFGINTARMALDGGVGMRYDRSLDTPEGQRRRLGAANVNGATMWNGAVLRYTISPTFGGPQDVALLEASMKEITDKTGIKFEESTQGSHITYVDGQGCSSAVGDINPGQQRTQPLTLKAATTTSPGNCRIQGIVVHELLHALGLWHQQSSTDRDTYVKLYEDRIRPQNLFNFNKLRATNNYVGYSFSSIMHYSRLAFGLTQGVNVMEAVDVGGAVNLEKTAQMGQRTQLDPTDAIELQIMYHSHIANPTAGLTANQPVADIKDLCTARAQCAEGQGNCKADGECKGNLYCAASVGVYEHLGQRAEVPGLNACLLPAMKPTFAPVTGGAVAVTLTPTVGDLLSTDAPSTQAPSVSAVPGAPTPFDLTIGDGDGDGGQVIPPEPQNVGPFTVWVQARNGEMTMEVMVQDTVGWLSVAFDSAHADGTDSVTCVLGTTPTVYDTYSGEGKAHRLDAIQDTTLISATIEGGVSKCAFSRLLTTTDATDAALTIDLANTMAVAYGQGAVTMGGGDALNYNQHPPGGYTSAQVTIKAAKLSSSAAGPDSVDEKVNGQSGTDSTTFIAIGSAAGLFGVAGVVTMARRRNNNKDDESFYTPPTSYNMGQSGQPQQQMGYYPNQQATQQQKMSSGNPMFGHAL